jgi:uncharacterized protein involved in tellurium resistance
MPRSPSSAPPRPDLAWLRHRTLRRAQGTRTDAGAAGSPVADFFTGRAARPARGSAPGSAAVPAPTAAPRPAPSSDLDLSAGPDLPSELDLSPDLDLSTDLDLSPGPGPATPAPVPPGRPSAAGAPRPASAARALHRRPVPRVLPGSRTILTTRDPTVTLNRVQSGVGTLTVDAVCSPAVGDLRLGALYQLADATSSIVQRATGIPAAPPGSRRPVITGSWGEFDRLTVDLRQSRTLRRLLVYAFSESGGELAWGGTLVTTTFGGARIELPLDLGSHRGPVALLSLYNIDGEFVLRAEMEKVDGPVRDVARLFGYDRITWADDRTPVR